MTLLTLLKRMPDDKLKVPAGKRTTVCGRAEEIAALMFAAVTLAGVFRIVQAEVLHGERDSFMMVEGVPACDQSIARLGLMMPDQDVAAG